ncbi:MAG: DUF922 domain-containing protein [Rhizobiaceae bacterium]
MTRQLLRGLAVFAVLVFIGGCQKITSNRVAVDYYSISGNSTKSLDRQIRLKGPKIKGGRHAVAVARIRIIPDIKFKPVAGGCAVSRSRVNVDAKVTLPRWTGRRMASKKLGKAWDNIDRYTRMHEAVHVAIAFRFAQRMENELSSLRSSGNCEALKRRAETVVARHLEKHDQTQKQFDEDEQKKLLAFARASRKKRS